MDTKTLVVGQDVYMHSGIYSQKGKVVKVTPSGVEVQTTDELLGFDTNGRACTSDKGVFAWETGGVPGTYEGGPWHLDDIPPRTSINSHWLVKNPDSAHRRSKRRTNKVARTLGYDSHSRGDGISPDPAVSACAFGVVFAVD